MSESVDFHCIKICSVFQYMFWKSWNGGVFGCAWPGFDSEGLQG